MRPRFGFLLTSLLLPAREITAQEQSPDTARVAPVVVTATRVPMSLGALPVSVSVITSEHMRALGIATVSDALTGVSSAYVAQSGSQGATTSLFLRGGESKYVKVLMDGVPVNDPGGSFDFASLTTDNVERIEVVRGPASVIYGADAVTGVVNVITRSGGSPRSHAEFRISTAPRDSIPGRAVRPTHGWNASGGVSGAFESGSYALQVGRHETQGLYAFNNAYQNNVLSGRFSFTPSVGTDLRVSLRYTDYQYNYPTDGGGTPVDSNAQRGEDRVAVGVEIGRAISGNVRAVLALNSSVNDGGTDDAVDEPGGNSFVSQDKIRRRGAELRLHVLPTSTTALTLGAQMEQQDQRSQAQGQFGAFGFTSLFRAARRNTGVYGELLFTPSDRLTATFGARLDDNERFGQFGTGRVGLSWRPLSATRLRVAAGTAFREPSFFENYASGFVTGNPDLKPERARSIDGGIEQEMFDGRLHVALTGFAQRFRDMIDFTGDDSACGFSYCNVAAASANGLETELRSRVWRSLWASAGYTMLRTLVIEPGFDSSSAGLYRRGQELIRRPRHSWSAELAHRGRSQLSGAVRVTGVGSREDRDFTPVFPDPVMPVTLPAFHRIDLGAEYALPSSPWQSSAITLRIENIENSHYQTVFNFLAPRRTISVGVRSSF